MEIVTLIMGYWDHFSELNKLRFLTGKLPKQTNSNSFMKWI